MHILHFGGTGYPLDFFQGLPGKKILRFHNITPISFFKDFISEDFFKTFERNEIKSNLELYSLHRSLSYVLSDSNFNQMEYLKLIGEANKTKMLVLPVIRNYPQLAKKDNRGKRIGFIGRWAPNKKIEDLLFTLFFLQKIDPSYTLVLIGKTNPVFQIYNHYLYDLIQKLELSDRVEIHENLKDEEVKEQLSTLDIYLSMSEHEGFGIPILEAMAIGVLVLAFSSSAVIETVKDAGLLFTQKDFPLLAELIHNVISSPELKDKLIQSQFKRVKAFNEFPFAETLLGILKS
jgi:glycosyltransferase involved in cell wall biosynthesis